MKKNWPACCLLVLLCVIMVCAIPAHATETRASDKIDLSSVTLGKKSNGDLSIYFSVQATGTMEIIGASSVEIQRNTGIAWVTEYTFTTSNTQTLQQENRSQYGAVLTYSPRFTGVEYRAVVMIYAKDATGSTTQKMTSKTVVA